MLTIETNKLRTISSILKNIHCEARIEISPLFVGCRVVNKDFTYLGDFKIHPEQTEKWYINEEYDVGVSTKELYQVLKSYKKDSYVTLEISPDKRTLQISGDDKVDAISLIDETLVSKTPNKLSPEMFDRYIVFTTTIKELKSAFSCELDLTRDSKLLSVIHFKNDDVGVNIYGKNINEKTSIPYYALYGNANAICIEVAYDVRLLKKWLTSVPTDSEVKIYLGNKNTHPIFFSINGLGIDNLWACAPCDCY
jgi:hypothetical protein